MMVIGRHESITPLDINTHFHRYIHTGNIHHTHTHTQTLTPKIQTPTHTTILTIPKTHTDHTDHPITCTHSYHVTTTIGICDP